MTVTITAPDGTTGNIYSDDKADKPVGIVVYGYGQDTSYMYPGGLDLKRITEPPVR